MKYTSALCLSAACTGAINGSLGAGGGMVLVPLLSKLVKSNQSPFSTSLLLMLPICAVSLLLHIQQTEIPWGTAWVYLIGSGIGGLCAGRWGKSIPHKWLHRILGLIILFGGVRFLWN